MSDASFADIQKDTRAMITKIKESDPELGAYFEAHIIFDEKNETLTYTGESEVLGDMLSKAIIS